KALPAPQVRTAAASVEAPVHVSAPVAAEAPKADTPAPVAPAAEAAGDTFTQATAEAAIAAIWSRILGVQGIGARDNFFDLGGHSLLAVQAHREIRADLGIRSLSITDIFRFPVLSALAAKLVGQPMPAGTAAVAASPAPAPAAPPVAPPAPVVTAPVAAPAPVPVSYPSAPPPQVAHPSENRATYRTEAMIRRRQLRAERLTRAG
ncbi:MAG: phosphopantetheine-binding protein, partial [Paracoccaceae bacterium]|nr:phosphopantetheine-binding protein [Paracoccaceae bacterium]